ncbi:MAG: amidophosphoribosyltransferase [Bacteroidales bacterium]|nr:amidophosphoribosyltransferase [Bacteroidales bacterium]
MEPIKHECGIAVVRLRKPLEYYHRKYGTWMYGLNKLYLLMEKQHNRGQEGAGVACVKQNMNPGEEFMFRERAEGANAITEVFAQIHSNYDKLTDLQLNDPLFAANTLPFAGNSYIGHLRYSTTGRSGISYVHPFMRRSNWKSKNLAVCGNFNFTNVDEVFEMMYQSGQHPRRYADTFILLEQLGHRLDREVERVYQSINKKNKNGQEINEEIETNIKIENVLRSTVKHWDGGFVICGLTGSGETFVVRDPWGIRPAYYYVDDEIVVVASERPVIQTVMNVESDSVHEVNPGEAVIVKQDASIETSQIVRPKKKQACSFERIYFSRGSDSDIYKERKKLGENLVPAVLKAVDNDIDNTVFSFIPNTAEVAFYGMLEGFEKYLNTLKEQEIIRKGNKISSDELHRILSRRIRFEKVAIKDIKLRTFISESNTRNDLATHVYDVTYGSIVPYKDNLVVIDDSIVRGTTLKQSIIRMLDRLHPKKIVIVSSSPQIRYPDCYGIDMSRMGEFIAFKAAIALLQEKNMQSVIQETYEKAKQQQHLPKEQIVNYVKDIYKPFTDEQISDKIAELLTPSYVTTKISIVYQKTNGLHDACKGYSGDWYFTGNYPTPGGNKLVNNAFINFVEGNDDLRALK